MANKVKFGLNNVYYAPETETDVYGTPVRLLGGVNLSLEANGDESPFYADDSIFYNVVANQGYTGELEVAMISEEFEKTILGREVEDETYVSVEGRDDKYTKFALMYEIKGDTKNRRYTLYGCTCSRPTSEASTVTESIEPQTDTFSFTAAGLTNSDAVCLHTTEQTPENVYNKWFEKVRMPGDGLGE